MKKTFAKIAATTLMVAMVMTGCGGGQQGGAAPEGGGEADAGDTVKIGWIGPLTGDNAVWGTCERDTLQMLVDEQNEKGGFMDKKIELVGYDTKGDATEAVNAVKRLTAQDKVIAILGPNSSGQALSISGILEQTKVPDIATVATNPKVTVGDDGNVKPYNFRICFIDPYQGAVAAGYAAEKLGFKSAAVLYDVTSDYSQGLTEFFEKSFTEKGGKIVAKEGFKAGDVDFRAQLSKIKEANPEVIFMPYFYKEVALSANQARDLGITATLMGGDGWPSDQLIEMAKDSIEGSYVVNHLDFNDPEVQPLQEKYKAKYDKNLEINGYLVHDAFLLLEAAINKAGSLDSDAIAAAISEVELKGITGNINISPDTHNPEGKEAAIIKITDGNYEFQEKYAAN